MVFVPFLRCQLAMSTSASRDVPSRCFFYLLGEENHILLNFQEKLLFQKNVVIKIKESDHTLQTTKIRFKIIQCH